MSKGLKRNMVEIFASYNIMNIPGWIPESHGNG